MSDLTKNPNRASTTLATLDTRGERMWQYPVWFAGKWIKRRTLVHGLLLVALLVGPWIDVAGHPAIRFDIPQRRAYFWGLQFFATDGIYIALALLTALLGIFATTALFGRAWCGWACPQSVFLETLIRPIERLIEGTPGQRKRLDQSPWTLAKVGRKILKWAAYSMVCGAIGTTFVAYFLGREGVLQAQAEPWSHPAGTAIFLTMSGLALFDFAWFREQTCLVVCPYGRFQSVLLDHDSIAVGYDFRRGEPRGKAKRVHLNVVENRTSGDCVDCHRCVQVCPTGIDIRNGQQMECVQCMACIDVCDDTMTKLGRHPGLIRFDSERVFAGGRRRILRPRVLFYLGGTCVAVLVLMWSLTMHAPVEVHLGRQKGSVAVVLPDGRLQNAYELRLANKSGEKKSFVVRVVDPKQAEIYVPSPSVSLASGEVRHVPIFVAQPSDQWSPTVTLRIDDDAGDSLEKKATFLGAPAAHGNLRPAARE